MQVPPILASKKFLAAALASVIAFLCLRQGMSREDTLFVVGPLLTFVGVQGIADIGKPRAQAQSEGKLRELVFSPIPTVSKPTTTTPPTEGSQA